MRKLFTSIIVSTIVLAFSANVAYAINIEKIAMDENTLNMLEEQENSVYEMPDIDVSKLMCDEVDRLEFGNGVYLQTPRFVNGNEGIVTPPRYLPAGFSNSPMYVYDENLNYIKSIEFEGYVTGIWFYEGCFYFTIYVFDGKTLSEYHIYKTVNGDEWIEITYDEYTLVANEKKLYDDGTYTWIQKKTQEGGMTIVHRDRVEYLIDSSGTMCPIECENNKYVYLKSDIDATDFTFFIRTKRSMEDYNDFSKF